MDSYHLDVKHALVLVDLGCGLGKLIIQTFLQHLSVKKCVGVELAASRASIACEAARELARVMPKHFRVDQHLPGVMVRVRSISNRFGKNRILEIRKGNMWHCNNVKEADSIVLHTELTKESIENFKELLANMKIGCRFVTVSTYVGLSCALMLAHLCRLVCVNALQYQNVNACFQNESEIPFEQLPVNIDHSVRL